MKTLFALATSEVQGDVVDTNAEAFGSMEEADNAARSFMLGRVGSMKSPAEERSSVNKRK